MILQSGTALNPYFLDEQPISTIRSFAHYARCPPSRNIDGLTACFESLKTSELLNYFKRFFVSLSFEKERQKYGCPKSG